MKSKEDGFTLIELVFILMIISILLLFPVLSVQRTIESTQVDLFFRDLTSKITQIQSHAILYDQTTNVQFYPQNNAIRFRVVDANVQEDVLRDIWIIDSPYYELSGTSNKEFTFKKGSGNISRSDRIYINTTKGNYELVFLMGSGRFEIRER